MNAQTLLEDVRRSHPDLRFARTDSEIGVWENGRFVPFISLTITGHWVNMPNEILINGQRIERNWIE